MPSINDPFSGSLPTLGDSLPLTDDAFGDPFDLAALPLPRPGGGYAVQKLDTDTLLDRHSGEFLAIRNPRLAGLFDSFAAAYEAASTWIKRHPKCLAGDMPLAIVPAAYDPQLQRHILIYGIQPAHPWPEI